MLCELIFSQNGQLDDPNLPKNGFRGLQFQKTKSGFGISTPKIPCEPIFSQNEQLRIFRLKFGKIAQLRAIFWSK